MTAEELETILNRIDKSISDAIEPINGTIDNLVSRMDVMNGRLNSIAGLVSRHDEFIETAKKQPSAVKAVIWVGSIIGVFILIAGLLKIF